MDKIKIENYKGVDLFYNKDDGRIVFEFESSKREVKYVFEAYQIIDEPVWEECDLKGVYADGYVDKYIGMAIAKRKNKKNGKPDWKLKGQYDLEYREQRTIDNPKIFIANEANGVIYEKWKEQKEIYQRELRKLNDIVNQLS